MKVIGLGSSVACMAAGHATSNTDGRDSRPNIIFILTDDQRWDAMSCMGHDFVRTPNMDRIAREGTLFTNAFCTTSLCSPSRATFLTGTYAHTHGVINNYGREYDPAITPTYPALLQKAGYETAHVGKWHQAPHDEPRQGYDYWLSFRDQGIYHNPWLNENGRRFQAQGYTTDLLSDYAVNFIKQDRERPFCLTLSHKAVHEPFQPPQRHKGLYKGATLKEPASFKDDFAGKSKWHRREYTNPDCGWRFRSSEFRTEQVPERIPPGEWDRPKAWWNEGERWRAYYECINSVDDGIGRLYEALEESGQRENTLIVFASDNGYFLGEHRRHDKRIPYEESIRIAFLVSYPRSVPAGRRCEALVLNTDLAPTVLDYAGIEIPKTVQGKSLRRVLEGSDKPLRDAIFHEYYVDLVHTYPRMLCVRTRDMKYITYPDIDDIDDMYDLARDPHELVNVAEDPAYGDRKAALQAQLKRLMEETDYRHEPPNLTPGAAKGGPKGVMLNLAFGETANGRIPDKSGNGLDGLAPGLKLVQGPGGKTAEFTGKEVVTVTNSEKLDPSKGAWTVEARIRPSADGAILSHGDERNGYALFIEQGVPGVAIMENHGWMTSRTIVDGKQDCRGQWTHLAAVISERKMWLYVNGELADWLPVPVPLTQLPGGDLLVGQSGKEPVDKELPLQPYKGLISMLRLHRGPMTKKDIKVLMYGLLTS
jgi:N-acetylglucosamine-6-sulfatase